MQDAATNAIVASGTTLVSEVGFAGLAPCHVYSMKVAAISSGVQGPYSEPLVMMTGGKGIIRRFASVFISHISLFVTLQIELYLLRTGGIRIGVLYTEDKRIFHNAKPGNPFTPILFPILFLSLY